MLSFRPISNRRRRSSNPPVASEDDLRCVSSQLPSLFPSSLFPFLPPPPLHLGADLCHLFLSTQLHPPRRNRLVPYRRLQRCKRAPPSSLSGRLRSWAETSPPFVSFILSSDRSHRLGSERRSSERSHLHQRGQLDGHHRAEGDECWTFGEGRADGEECELCSLPFVARKRWGDHC